jgi:hypothetical protein
MRLMKFTFLSLLSCVAGCGVIEVDPCAGQAGTCLAVHVSGARGGVDLSQLHFSVTRLPERTVVAQGDSHAADGGPLRFPLAAALVFDTFPGSGDSVDVEVSAQGLADTTVRAGGAARATLRRARHGALRLQLTAVSDSPPPPGDDAGAGVDAGGTPPPCPTLYVSVSGDNASSGCLAAAPKRTIRAALEARTRQTEDVRVCAGLYSEGGLTVTGTLLGGFDCATWARDPKAHETVVETRAALPALSVVDGVAVIDGFTIVNAGGPGDSPPALHLSGGSTTLTNNRIDGGASNGASIGLLIDGDAEAEVASNAITGGVAPERDLSVGVKLASAGRVHLRDNDIDGGSGASSHAGLLIVDGKYTLETGSAIEHNYIRGGSSRDAYVSTIAARIDNAPDVDLIANRIDGGSFDTVTRAPIAIQYGGTGRLRVLRNHIRAGAFTRLKEPWDWRYMVGIEVEGSGSVEVANNLIHAGDSYTSGLWPIGIRVAGGSAVIRHNTMFSGRTDGLAHDIFVSSQATGVVVENNILGAGEIKRQAYPLYLEICPFTGAIASYRNNLVFNSPGVLAYSDLVQGCGSGNGFTIFPTAAAADAELANECGPTTAGACAEMKGVKLGGNLVLRSACGNDPSCIATSACATGYGCLAELFPAWDLESNGVVNVLGDGLRLGPQTPCAVSRSSLDLTDAVSVDIDGQARTSLPSMGAHERDDGCR